MLHQKRGVWDIFVHARRQQTFSQEGRFCLFRKKGGGGKGRVGARMAHDRGRRKKNPPGEAEARHLQRTSITLPLLLSRYVSQGEVSLEHIFQITAVVDCSCTEMAVKQPKINRLSSLNKETSSLWPCRKHMRQA